MVDKSVRKPSRAIHKQTALFLYVQAGGRCEFDGCNKYLLEHYPTEAIGNFAEQAHIYAFSEGGPRGNGLDRPHDINSLENLMLLCPECHHLVDSVSPSDFPVETLKRFKRDHEDRIFLLTQLSKNRDTIPLVLKGCIAGRLVDISNQEMQAAVAPNWLKQRQKIEIDLNAISDRPNIAFWQIATELIDQKIQQLYALKPEPDTTLRTSVFALAPIPLLIYLGSKLSDKMEVDLYQRHRNPETWSWEDGSGNSFFTTNCLTRGEKSGPVILFVNISGKNGQETIPEDLGRNGAVYELTLEGQDPNPLCLNTRMDLQRFTSKYIRALATIRQLHPNLDCIHLFPAVPAPIAITLGRARLPKVDPLFKVYDRDARARGFILTLEVS
ncbi:MAG: SAVED domain-containing protein [Elainellaceae cyanobacterium]